MKSHMRMLVSTIAMCILTMGLITGCGNKQKDNSVETVISQGTLKVAIPNYDTAFLYFDKNINQYRGIEAEVATVIAQDLGVSVEYLPVSKDSLTNEVKLGNADIAIGHIDTYNSDISSVLSSISYGGEDLYVISPRGIYVGNLDVFDKKPVGVSAVIDQSAYSGLYTSGAANVVSYSDTMSVVDALRNNSIAGYVCYRAEGAAIAESGEFQIQSCKDLPRESFVIISSQICGKLIEECNKCIEAYLNGEMIPEWVQAEDNVNMPQQIDGNSLYNN